MVHGTAHSANPIMIDDDRCQVCDVCAAKQKCHGGAFRFIDKGEPPVLDLSHCWGCLLCIVACPHQAVVRQSSMHTP